MPGPELSGNPTVDYPQHVSAPRARGEEGLARVRTLVAIGIVGVLGLGAVGYNTLNAQNDDRPGVDPSDEPGTPTPTLNSGNFNEAQEPRTVTDKELSEAGYNCGKGLETFLRNGKFNYTPMFDFYEDKPKLAKEIYDLNVNDPQYGMGKEAWDVLLSQGLENPDTDKTKKLDTDNGDIDAEMTKYLQRMSRTLVGKPRTYINFTCEGGVRPVDVIRLGEGQKKNAVNGIVLTEEGLEDFRKVARNLDRFDVIYLDSKDNGPELWMVVLTADGCKNPNRLPKPTPKPGTSPKPKATRSKPTNTTTPRTYSPKPIVALPATSISPQPGDASPSPEVGEGPSGDTDDGYDASEDPKPTVTPSPTPSPSAQPSPSPSATTGPVNDGSRSQRADTGGGTDDRSNAPAEPAN